VTGLVFGRKNKITGRISGHVAVEEYPMQVKLDRSMPCLDEIGFGADGRRSRRTPPTTAKPNLPLNPALHSQASAHRPV
jgi:hypothetical protein